MILLYLQSKSFSKNLLLQVMFYSTEASIIFIIFWDYLTFYLILLTAQVIWCAIITYKHGIYELPHEFPNDLRKLGRKELNEIRKHQESV